MISSPSKTFVEATWGRALPLASSPVWSLHGSGLSRWNHKDLHYVLVFKGSITGKPMDGLYVRLGHLEDAASREN